MALVVRVIRVAVLLLLPVLLVVVWGLGPVAWVMAVMVAWRVFRRRRDTAGGP